MPNWKKFIVKENSGTGNITCLEFDGEVYNRSNRLSFFNRHPFNSFLPGDEVEIDVDEAIGFMKDVDRWYKETNRGGYDLILKRRIGDESIIRPIRCRFQENMALVSWNSNELSMVRNERDSLKTQNYNLQREKDNYQNLVRVGEKELTTKNNQITTLSSQLTTAQNQLREKEGQLTLSREEVKRITDLFNALQLENNRKDEEIKKQKDKIKELKGELNVSKEEVINHKLDAKEGKLEIFAHQLGVNWNQVRDLRNACKQLIRVQESNYNQDNLDTAKENKENAKQAIKEISIENRRKLCRKCEKLAKLEIEHEKILKQQSQYQAHQEQPTNN